MSLRISTNLAVGFCALLLFAEVGFAQERNSTVYPDGGVPDKRQKKLDEKTSFEFNKRVNFSGATFDSIASFSRLRSIA